jgi:hypothetical protein
MRLTKYLLLILMLIYPVMSAAQIDFSLDFSSTMEIPAVKTISASESHLYVLSDEVGLAVFRAYPDKLQWLYTSAGMQRRGDRILTDTRFAYLFGSGERLTVLEPTNVLGVYSATMLPAKPLGVARLGNQLYLALGQIGLGQLSLNTPESVDSVVVYPVKALLNEESVLDVKSSQLGQQLFVLSDANKVYVFSKDGEKLSLNRTVEFKADIRKLFSTGQQLYGSTALGDVFEIRTRGLGLKLGTINEEVSDLLSWKDYLFIRGESGRTWFIGKELFPFKQDILSKNYITANSENLWVSENNKISRLLMPDSISTNSRDIFSELILEEIPDRVLTYPNSLIQPFTINATQPISEVTFSVRSDVRNYKVRGQSLFWQPGADDLGEHEFTVIVNRTDRQSDSTTFRVDVRQFNSPPRFSPLRPTSIGVNEEYVLDIIATDPESLSSNLVRYIGVDLPEGSSLNEETGEFRWTPSATQVGKHIFKVIATDQLGAASTIDVSITVLDQNRDN